MCFSIVDNLLTPHTNYQMNKIVVFVLLLVVFVGFNSLNGNQKSSYDIFMMDKIHSQEKFDIVFCGDSRVQMGISPYVVENELASMDVDVLNFGIRGNSVNPVTLKFATDKLKPKTSSKKRIIAIGISPNSLTRLSQQNELFFSWVNKPVEEILFNRIVGNNLIYFQPISPSRLYYCLSGKTPEEQIEFEYRGWRAVHMRHHDTHSLEGYQQIFSSQQVENQYIDELLEYIKAIKATDVEVIGFRVPCIEQMWQLEDSLSGFDEMEFSRKFEEAGGNWLEFKNDPLMYQSYDGSHLDKKSAIVFSRQLGDSIKATIIETQY